MCGKTNKQKINALQFVIQQNKKKGDLYCCRSGSEGKACQRWRLIWK